MKHIKYVLSFLLLLSIFSVKTFAQGPTDDPGDDPGGDIFSYQNGYCEGAISAYYFKELLVPNFEGEVKYVTWYLYDEDAEGHLGAEVDFNSPGIKIPVITYSATPTSDIFNSETVTRYLNRLREARNDSAFDSGYFRGFYEHWYNY